METSKVDRRVYKKCIKCREWKLKANKLDDDGLIREKRGFGDHDSSDGLQAICFSCKNLANNKSRQKNVSARIRHHTGTRCLTQLGESAPPGLVSDLESYLGYKISALVKHLGKDLKEREGPTRKLRDALNEGYHIDHIRPLSSFNVIILNAPHQGEVFEVVDWEVFRECWSISNLMAIPAEQNLQKGATYHEANNS